MDLYEYQAKELFRAHGVPAPHGTVVTTVDEAVAAADRLGLPVMVKSQVKIGGRGKAGGVKFAASTDDVRTHAGNILGLDIKGHVTRQVLITPASGIAEEYYVSFLLDRANRTFLAMATHEGGMEIEQLAEERPDALAKIPVDALIGVDATKAAEIAAIEECLPIDPFTGQPMKYVVDEKGYRIYSVGTDRVDDGGPDGTHNKDSGVWIERILPK